MGKLAIICLGMALSSPAFAQSASSFDPVPSPQVEPVPGSEKVAKPAKRASAPSGDLNSTPSRLIGPPEIESYLKAISSLFLIRNREYDPFGMAQNPDAAPVAKPSIFGNTTAVVTPQATPFSEIVPLIVVTTFMPREKKFLFGSRLFKQGDLIPLKYRGKLLRVQILEVSSQQIIFRNLDTGETVSRRFNGLPAGLTPGGQGITVPGMTPDSPNAPIELEASDSAP